MLPFESKSTSNHTESAENWNKRGTGRVKVNSLQILNVCGLLKLNCPPSCRCNTFCSPLESLYALQVQQDALWNSVWGFLLISEWVDVQFTVCLFPFPSTPGYLVLLSSVQTHALFSPVSKQKILLPLPPLDTLLFPVSCCSRAVELARNLRDSVQV